ncbi:MAG: zinc ribbon domain-containing protein, partial [Gemmatimonadaceae bacterium]|nr:zinc ribbon domain-containing protein [Gemmatimonadaceae bacterium]
SATRASPSELAVMAARATEAVEVTTAAPLAATPQPTVVNNLASNPAPPTHRPLFASDQAMTAPRSSPSRANASESCRYCSGSLPEGRRVTFCPGCGHNLTVQHCPACASELEVGWKFCITCGREVG